MSSTAEKLNVTSLIELNDETIENEKTDSSRKHHRQSVGFEGMLVSLTLETRTTDSLYSDRVNHTSSTPKTSPTDHHPLVQSSALSPPSIKSMNKQTTGRSINQSPTSSHAGERRLSWASSTSLAFDTPQSSFSRTTTNQTISSSPTVLKNDAATEVSSVSNMEMITQLISQTKLNTVDNQTDTDSSPPELSRQLFRQSTFVSPNTNYQTRHSLVKQQLLRLGRYEIEVLFPGDHDRVIDLAIVALTIVSSLRSTPSTPVTFASNIFKGVRWHSNGTVRNVFRLVHRVNWSLPRTNSVSFKSVTRRWMLNNGSTSDLSAALLVYFSIPVEASTIRTSIDLLIISYAVEIPFSSHLRYERSARLSVDRETPAGCFDLSVTREDFEVDRRRRKG